MVGARSYPPRPAPQEGAVPHPQPPCRDASAGHRPRRRGRGGWRRAGRLAFPRPAWAWAHPRPQAPRPAPGRRVRGPPGPAPPYTRDGNAPSGKGAMGALRGGGGQGRNEEAQALRLRPRPRRPREDGRWGGGGGPSQKALAGARAARQHGYRAGLGPIRAAAAARSAITSAQPLERRVAVVCNPRLISADDARGGGKGDCVRCILMRRHGGLGGSWARAIR